MPVPDIIASNLLSWLIFLPIIASCLIFILAGDRRPLLAKSIALLTSFGCLLLCIPLWQSFAGTTQSFQFTEFTPWFVALNINYALGVDGFAMPLIVLTCIFTPLIIISAWRVIETKVAHYLSAFLIMQGLMCGAFAAMDAILFYIFFEAMLIPMFLIIGIWGGPNRIYATVKFFIYTFFGSVFFLIALLYLNYIANTQNTAEPFLISSLSSLKLNLTQQSWVLLGFLLSFAVKVPMFPVHTWLPDAHVEAPTGGSVILAAILLKVGGYGFLRFILPMVPDAASYWQLPIIIMSLIAVVYIGFVAIVQTDLKKLIAYSSVAHMGFVTLGIFLIFNLTSANQTQAAAIGVQGAYIQMISHGFISGALFLCVGVLYDRMHTRNIQDYSGVANKMPIFASFFVFFALANTGLPGTSGFVGEFLVILAAFNADPIVAALAGLTLILSAAYMLWMVKRVIFGEVSNSNVKALTDINLREFSFLAILAGFTLLLGLYPQLVFNKTEGSVVALLNSVTSTKL